MRDPHPQKNRTADSIVNAVNQLYRPTISSFLVVEGPKDNKLYQKFKAEGCEIIIAGEKELVIESLRLLREQPGRLRTEADRVVGIVDTDFDALEGNELDEPRLFSTDTHDSETLMLNSPSFYFLLIEVADSGMLEGFLESEGGKDLTEILLDLALPLGYLRWFQAHQEHRGKRLYLRFKGLNYSSFVRYKGRHPYVDGKKLVKALKKNSKYLTLTESELFDELSNYEGRGGDPWLICQGHDMIKILLILLINDFGDRYYMDRIRGFLQDSWLIENAANNLESDLRKSYDTRHFSSTTLYSSILEWEKRCNPPVKVFNEL